MNERLYNDIQIQLALGLTLRPAKASFVWTLDRQLNRIYLFFIILIQRELSLSLKEFQEKIYKMFVYEIKRLQEKSITGRVCGGQRENYVYTKFNY